MTEITLPFWQASAVLNKDQTVENWLQSEHIRARWIDEVVWIIDEGTDTTSSISGLKQDAVQTKWIKPTISEQYFLHGACREIALGERQLVLLLSVRTGHKTAVLLAGPVAAGMYNLMPQAYIEEWFQFSGDETALLTHLDQALAGKKRKSSAIKALALLQADGKRPSKTDTPFAGATWVKMQDPGEGPLAVCHELVTALIEKQQKNGLAVEETTDKAVYATWIERI